MTTSPLEGAASSFPALAGPAAAEQIAAIVQHQRYYVDSFTCPEEYDAGELIILARLRVLEDERDQLRAQVSALQESRVELLREVWYQFSLEGGKPEHPYSFEGRWAGGLSTLESIATELREVAALRSALQDGRPNPDPQEPA